MIARETRDQTLFRLTTPRREILTWLAQYRYLRTTHFYGLRSAGAEGSQRVVRRILHDFWKRGYIHRKPIVDYAADSPFPRYENVYWLSPSGHTLASEELPTDTSLVPSGEKSPHSLEHEMAITDVHLAVERTARDRGFELYWRQADLKHGVNPDALFALTEPGLPDEASTFYYFLEVERSRQGNYRDGESGLLRKIERYCEYQGSAKCLSEWKWFDQFRVVIIMDNAIRAENLLTALRVRFPFKMLWIGTRTEDVGRRIFRTPADYSTATYSFFDQ